MTSRAVSRRDAGGFTLIEVLAAIVIFSTGAVVLFGWIGQTADRLVLVNREERLLFAQLGALEFARTLNPTLRPTGTEQIGETTVRWASQEVGAPAPSYNPAGSAGAYLVQLYRVKLEVEAGANLSAEKTIYLAGWQQTRPAGVRGAFDTTPLPASPGTP